MAEDNGRISVSRDALRAELGALELRLVDRITEALEGKADATILESVRARVHTLESQAATVSALVQQYGDQEKRIRALERFRYAMPSVAAVSALCALALALHGFHVL